MWGLSVTLGGRSKGTYCCEEPSRVECKVRAQRTFGFQVTARVDSCSEGGQAVTPAQLQDNQIEKKKSSPFMWYTEASEYPSFNRRMRGKPNANISSGEHLQILLIKSNIVHGRIFFLKSCNCFLSSVKNVFRRSSKSPIVQFSVDRG